jgi:ABC-2 type transport system ATP-binding protein
MKAGRNLLIKIENLYKKFDGFTALDGLNLNVRKGSIYGLVGVNGSGKTTIIRHLTGTYRQDSGSVTIDGDAVYDNINVKKRVGYIADDLYFFGNHSIATLKSFYSSLYKTWNGERFTELLALFELDPKRQTRKFSKGMQKQAAFIMSMSIMPDVLILDEPIDGLDPIVRNHVRRYIIKDVADRDMTVLLSSHNLKEVEGLCDTVGIIKSGRMISERELDDWKTGMFKLQAAFSPQTPPGTQKYSANGIHVLHYEKRENSSIETLIVKGSEDEVMAKVKTLNPLICDVLPLTLDEIFVYETEGMSNDITN